MILMLVPMLCLSGAWGVSRKATQRRESPLNNPADVPAVLDEEISQPAPYLKGMPILLKHGIPFQAELKDGGPDVSPA